VAGTNRRLAIKEAARRIAHFPVPPRATRADALPPNAGYLRRLRAQDGEVDTSLTRTQWWLVSIGYRRLINWYVAHTPADRRETQYPNGRVATQAVLDWDTHGHSSAYSQPAMIVAYTRLGPHSTAIRTDVTLAARADRTARTLVPATVTRIEITRQAIDGPNASPQTVTVTDQEHLNTVVAAFDRDPGWYRSVEPSGCGSPVGIVYLYAVTFYWPHHRLAADSGEPLCGIGRKLTRDNTTLPQTLSDDDSLDAALKTAFDNP
jgi:hypothetical protein